MKKTASGFNKPTLFYIGDLPTFRIDGITNSFANNLKILSQQFEICQIAEYRSLSESMASKVLKFFKLFKRITNSFSTRLPKIVYTNFALSFMGSIKTLMILNQARKYGAKTILHLHRGDFFDKYSRNYFNRLLAKRIIQRTDLIIVLATAIEKELQIKYRQKKFFVLPNTIEDEVNLAPIRNTQHRFIYLSNYLESKGIFDLLNVFKELVKKYSFIELNCYGVFPNKRICRKLQVNCSQIVTINAVVMGLEKFKRIRESSCLILPSRNEGQPLVILEAMSQSIPVIAGNIGHIPEMVGEKYPFLFDTKDEQSLKNTIEKVITHQNLETVGKELNNRYYNFYSRNEHSKKLLALFNEMLV